MDGVGVAHIVYILNNIKKKWMHFYANMFLLPLMIINRNAILIQFHYI